MGDKGRQTEYQTNYLPWDCPLMLYKYISQVMGLCPLNLIQIFQPYITINAHHILGGPNLMCYVQKVVLFSGMSLQLSFLVNKYIYSLIITFKYLVLTWSSFSILDIKHI